MRGCRQRGKSRAMAQSLPALPRSRHQVTKRIRPGAVLRRRRNLRRSRCHQETRVIFCLNSRSARPRRSNVFKNGMRLSMVSPSGFLTDVQLRRRTSAPCGEYLRLHLGEAQAKQAARALTRSWPPFHRQHILRRSLRRALEDCCRRTSMSVMYSTALEKTARRKGGTTILRLT